jgi:uncharacterized protein YecT (DUF1311 family)
MNKVANYLCCLMFLFETGGSFAGNICEEETTQQINKCMADYSKDEDLKLNDEYKIFKKKIYTSYPSNDPDMTSLLKIITESQRAWIKYRDLNCNVESSLVDNASLTHEMLTNKCIGRMSHIRAQELHEIAKEY